MDLTPPSLTDSPYSPKCRSLESPPPFASSGYMTVDSYSFAPLPSLESSCDVPPLSYGTLIDPSLSQTVNINGSNGGSSPFAPLDSVPASVAWSTPSLGTGAPSPPAEAVNGMSGLPPSGGYGAFGYESSPAMPAASPYPVTSPYSRPTSNPPAYMRTPPPSSTDVHGGNDSIQSFSPRSRPSNLTDPVTGVPHYAPGSMAPGPMPFVGAGTHMLLPDGMNHHRSRSQLTPSHANPDSLYPRSQPSAPPMPGPTATANHRNWPKVRKDRTRATRRHTTKEEANFQCMVKGCGKFFSRSYNFKSHMETHDEKREYPFPCQVTGCTKKFVRKTDLQRHHQSVHAKERNHRCDYCGRMFARRDTLRRHMEDGCSKRFEVGMLDSSSEAFPAKAQVSSTRPADLSTMAPSLDPALSLTPASMMGAPADLSLDGSLFSTRMSHQQH